MQLCGCLTASLLSQVKGRVRCCVFMVDEDQQTHDFSLFSGCAFVTDILGTFLLGATLIVEIFYRSWQELGAEWSLLPFAFVTSDSLPVSVGASET